MTIIFEYAFYISKKIKEFSINKHTHKQNHNIFLPNLAFEKWTSTTYKGDKGRNNEGSNWRNDFIKW